MSGSIPDRLPKQVFQYLLNTTIIPPPDGVEPNFEHPKFYGQPVNIAACICLPLVFSFAFLRFYCKFRSLRKASVDDYTFIVGFAAGVSTIALTVAMVNGGCFGYHGWEVKLGSLTKTVLMRSYVLSTIMGPVLWLIKLTLFCLILNSFRPVTWLRWMVYIGIVVSGLFYTAQALINGIVCRPQDGTDQLSWIAAMASRQCSDVTGIIQTMSVVSGSFNVVSDFYILILPLPVVAKLKISPRRKIGLYFIFLTGFLAFSMSVLGLYYRRRNWGTKDVMVSTVPLSAVTTIEISVGLIVPCMISSARVVQQWWKQVMLSRESRRKAKSMTSEGGGSTYVELSEGSTKKSKSKPDPWAHFDIRTTPSMTETATGTVTVTGKE